MNAKFFLIAALLFSTLSSYALTMYVEKTCGFSATDLKVLIGSTYGYAPVNGDLSVNLTNVTPGTNVSVVISPQYCIDDCANDSDQKACQWRCQTTALYGPWTPAVDKGKLPVTCGAYSP